MAKFSVYTSDKDLEITGNLKYRAIAAGTDYAIDDIIIKTHVIDPNTGLATGDTICINKTQDLAMSACPPIADLESVDGSADVEMTEKFETNTTTGEITELLQIQIFDQGGLPDGAPYFLNANTGAVVVPTGTVEDEPVRLVIGSETVALTDNATTATLASIPAFAVQGEGQVYTALPGVGGAVITLDGATTPDAAAQAGTRQGDGAIFELDSASELANFQMRAIEGTSDAGVYVEYYNIVQPS